MGEPISGELVAVSPVGLPVLPQPEAHWQLWQGDRLLGGCSLWWTQAPVYRQGDREHRVGCIGHFQATSVEAAQRLLDHGCAELVRKGCTLAIAPMDGSTWFPYRCVTQSSPEPPFWLEPQTPPEWPQWFEQAGFEAIATYESRLCRDLAWRDPRLSPVRDRLSQLGVYWSSPSGSSSVDPPGLSNRPDLLARLHQLTLRCFRHQPFFHPISLSQFQALYRPLLTQLNPDCLWVAYHHDQPIGFRVAFPDPVYSHRLILKTLAILPQRSYAGLGAVLVEDCHQRAQEQGFSQVIHALMHTGNPSYRLSQRYTERLRGYAVWGRTLAARVDG